MNDAPVTGGREAKRRTILDAAIRVFAEQGFFAARTRDIAAAAGIAEGTIYLYFDGKDDLLLSAFREKVDEFSRSMEPLLESEIPFAERLTHLIRMQFDGIETQPELATVLLLETRHSSKFYGEPVRDVLRTYARIIDELLGRGVAEGSLRPDLEIPLARRVVIGALEEIELDWLLGDRARPLSSQAESLTAMLMRGFAPTGAR
jgi:TetR/AcrR family transcriptional regulator, fatty acid metabolism regulator protein